MIFLAWLPPSWLLPWSADAAMIVSYPLRPIEWSFWRLRVLLRPAPLADDYAEERLRELADEREHYRSLWFAERLRSAEMEQRLAEVEGVRRFDRSGARPISATIISQSAGPGSELVTIDAGSEAGIRVGDPVVAQGDRLLGRVAEEPMDRRSRVVPLTHRSNGRIDALVEQNSGDGGASTPTGAFVPIQLTPTGGSRFDGEVAAGSGVSVGDIVRLSDPLWKRTAQGLRIGTVRSLRPLDANPLRLRVEVETDIEAARALGVVVKCEESP